MQVGDPVEEVEDAEEDREHDPGDLVHPSRLVPRAQGALHSDASRHLASLHVQILQW